MKIKGLKNGDNFFMKMQRLRMTTPDLSNRRMYLQ